MKYKDLLLIFGIILTISLVSCTNSPTGKVVNSQTYTFGGPKNINMLAIVADDLGIFDKYNLDVKRVDIQTGKMTMDALMKGDIDFGVLVDSNIAFINFQGDPGIEVIATIVDKYDDALVANKDSISHDKDFENKRIGITAGTTSHVFAVSYLKDRGIDLSKVEFVNMPPPSIQAAVINGNLDAGSLWQPFRYNVEKEKGNKAATYNDKDIYNAKILIAVRKDFAKENPEAVERFLRSLIDVENYFHANPEKVSKTMAKELNMPLNIINIIWDEYSFKVHMDKELLDTVEKQAEWIVELDDFKGKQIPDYEDSFNIRFLEKIDAARVKWK
jgi:NitT/TauT family transport system substrate-binding protein